MRSLKVCCICGRKKLETAGWFYKDDYLQRIGAKYSADVQQSRVEGLVYACNRCVFRLGKEKHKRDFEERKAIAMAGVIPQKEKEARALQETLEALSGWVRITDIARAMSSKLGHDVAPRAMGNILRKNGFTARKRGAKGYIFANIQKK